jgi:hypothetical protein
MPSVMQLLLPKSGALPLAPFWETSAGLPSLVLVWPRRLQSS